ncbi:hypothetical protein EMIT0P2_180018 [Pseudomonas sp. IT-P2]
MPRSFGSEAGTDELIVVNSPRLSGQRARFPPFKYSGDGTGGRAIPGRAPNVHIALAPNPEEYARILRFRRLACPSSRHPPCPSRTLHRGGPGS